MSKLIRQAFLCMVAIGCLFGCAEDANYAPVTELSAMEPIPPAGYHRVQPGETLYEIAWRYGLDYRYLAARNHIAAPYTIHVNDQIALQGNTATVIAAASTTPISESNVSPPLRQPSEATEWQAPEVEPEPIKPAEPVLPKMASQEPRYTVNHWLRPAKGPIINFFSMRQKGIDIAGTRGESVVAAADGKVVYSGNGLKRYGNLIILKHNHLYLSAYAHNQRMVVREGDWVKQGQKIAEMGNTGTNKVMLHFEIRKAGKPINPSSLLGS